MNEQKKQKLLEQYDDAAFALLMDEYAEEEGARLMAEVEAAQAAGQVPQMPAELDEQCRRMIRRDRVKKRGIRAARSFRKVAVKAAVAVLVFIGLMTTVVMSVEALRIPVLNFIVEHYEKYSTLTFNTTPQPQTNKQTYAEYFKTLLPSDYYEVASTITEHMTLVTYENHLGNVAQIYVTPAGGEVKIDTETAFYSEIELAEYKAILVEKDGYQVTWIDQDSNTMYMVHADGFTKDFILNICYQLATNVSAVTNQRSLKDLLADGYVELYCDYYDSEIFCGYENEDSSLVKYSAIIAEGTLDFDTEGAEYENITINSYEGFLIRKDGIHILWLDSDNGLVHSLYATDYPENELIDIANHLASGYLN